MSEEDGNSHVGFYRDDFQISCIVVKDDSRVFTAHFRKDGKLKRQGRYAAPLKVPEYHLWKIAAELRLYPYLQEDLGDG